MYIYSLSRSTNNHGSRSNGDRCMAVPFIVQVIQSTPFVISKLRNLVFNVQSANNVCCIRSMSSGILRNSAGKLIMWKLYGVIFQDLLLAKRKIRTVRPFHGIHIKKLRREGTISIILITSDSKCLSFIVSKAIWVFVTVLCRFYWTVIFAIEPSKICFHQNKKVRLLTNGILYRHCDENTTKLEESVQEKYCRMDKKGRKPNHFVSPIDSQLFCSP